MQVFVNTTKQNTHSANCVAIRLGDFGTYGVEVVRNWRLPFAFTVAFHRVRQTGARHVLVNLRAFGRGRCFTF